MRRGWISVRSPVHRSPPLRSKVIAARAWLRCWALLAALIGFAPWAAADVAVPPLREHVTDLAGALAAEQRAALEQTLTEFEAQRGAQLAVLIVPTTQPESIEQYSIRVVEQWKLGRKNIDDGVLLLVAVQDRALRIEVGYGLEGAIPDAVAKRVIAEVIVPYFKSGDYAGGVVAGVQQLMRLIEGEPLPAASRQAVAPGDLEAGLPTLLAATLIGGFMLRALFGRLAGAGLAGVGAAVFAWFLFSSRLLSIVLGALAFFFLLGGGGGLGGMRGGGLGGMRGGGGFGGGGGGFGGGGASGRW